MNAYEDTFGQGYIGEKIETPRDAHGRFFRATIEQDTDMGAPWEEHDGHGTVRKSKDGRDKAPGERPLNQANRNEYTFFYDWQGAIKTAKEEWGCPHSTLESRLGIHRTVGEQAACAVQADFDFLRGYFNDDWTWVGIVVSLHQELEGELIELHPHLASLWGMDSLNVNDYLTGVANELLEEARELPEAARVITVEEVMP